MSVNINALSLVVLVLAPVAALAQPDPGCEQQKQSDEVLGAVVGGGLGALLGNSVGGGRAGGTILGGVGGAAVGASVAGSGLHCGDPAFGVYDPNGQWVPNRPEAEGYYSPEGRWTGGAPPPFMAGAPTNGLPGVSRTDTREREFRLEARINAGLSDGSLAQDTASRDFRRLDDVRQMDAAYWDGNGDGGLSPDQHADIDQRLDSLRRELAIESPPRPY